MKSLHTLVAVTLLSASLLNPVVSFAKEAPKEAIQQDKNTMLSFSIAGLSKEKEEKAKKAIQKELDALALDPTSPSYISQEFEEVKQANGTFYTQLLDKMKEQEITVTGMHAIKEGDEDGLYVANVHVRAYDLSEAVPLAKAYINTSSPDYQHYTPALGGVVELIDAHNLEVEEAFRKELSEAPLVEHDFYVFAATHPYGATILQPLCTEFFVFLSQDYKSHIMY